MLPKVKKFYDSLMSDFDLVCPDHGNRVFYEPFFEALTAEAFENLLDAIEADTVVLPLVNPNITGSLLTEAQLIDVGRKFGHEFYQQVTFTIPNTGGLKYTTPQKFPNLLLPIRVQIQTLANKMGVQKASDTLDDLTGQATGDSKGSGITNPEALLLVGLNLTATLTELYSPRGGNVEAYDILNQQIQATGVGSLEQAINNPTRVKSAKTISTMLKSAHIGNNL